MHLDNDPKQTAKETPYTFGDVKGLQTSGNHGSQKTLIQVSKILVIVLFVCQNTFKLLKN